MTDIIIGGESWNESGNPGAPVLEGVNVGGYWWASDGKQYLDIGKVSTSKDLRLPWTWLEKLSRKGVRRLTVGCGSLKKGGVVYYVKIVGDK